MEFNRFDVSTKELIWDDPAAWLERFGIGPRVPVDVIDSDINALSACRTDGKRICTIIEWSGCGRRIPSPT
jgi:hypothetical protein